MTQRPSILFLSESAREEQGSRLYRCAYQAKQLTNAGLRAEVVYLQDARNSALEAADIVVFSRCKWEDKTLQLIAASRRMGKLICADLDDRIFAPWDVDNTGYMRSRARPKSTVSTRQAVIERDVLRLLPAFELVSVSTVGIQEELTALGIPARVTPNVFDTDRQAPIARTHPRLGRILVMSGTPTHDQDLRHIATPLARFLYENRDVECTLLGAVQVAGPLRGLPNLKRRELLPVSELYRFVAEHDLCLVPLEASVFNDCKSALKLIECGLVSVPVLASPRREYRALVRHGQNGFLARDDEDSWYQALCTLRDTPGLLAAGAAGAYETVVASHTVKSRGASLADEWIAYLGSRPAAKKRVRT